MVKYQHSDPLFTIAVAAQLVNLHPRTLMLYERAGLLKPFRTNTDRRRYSQSDLDRIKFINYLTQVKGANLGGIKLILEILKYGRQHHLDLEKEFFPDFKP